MVRTSSPTRYQSGQIEILIGLSKGITVLLGARNEQAGKEAVEKLTAQGINTHFLSLDITKSESIASAVQIVTERFGRLDILVNNAAVVPRGADQQAPSTIAPQLLAEHININFLAQVEVTQAFLPLIKLSKSGRIVNMSSTIGSVTIASEPLHQNGPKPPRLAYAAAKAALNMFTILLAKELVDTRIKVNAADPGATRTETTTSPLAVNTVDEGARPVVWLATLEEDGPTGCFFTHWKEHQNVNPW